MEIFSIRPTPEKPWPMKPRPMKPRSVVRTAAFSIVIGGTLAAGPVEAQFNNIFGNSPPRPPADVPNGFPAQPPPVGYPNQGQYQGQYQNPPPAARQPSAVQTQPLAPPPGATAAPTPTQRARATPAPAPAPAAAPAPTATTAPTATPAPANPPPPQPADASSQPDDTVVMETPTQKIPNARAVFSGLDKITGRTITFDSAIGETVQFGALQVTARACYTRPPTEATNTDAFVEVDEVTLQGEIKRIFTGWMFAASPGLHAVEHPIYDVWLTDCKGGKNPAVAEVPDDQQPQQPAKPAPKPQPQKRPPPPRSQQQPGFLPALR
jgi:hypothetical protein